MMSGERKITTGLVLRGILAVTVGMVIVTAFVALLSLYGESQEDIQHVASKTLAFPENERMLESMADQLAREGAALSKIEPAAGDKTSPEKKN